MRIPFAAAALSLVLAAPVLAQTAPSQPMTGAGTPAAGASAVAQGQIRASRLIDRDVYSADNVEVGEVEDLILDGQGRIVGVVIELENRLGFTERYISVPFAQLQIGDRRVTLPMTREQIRTMPGFQYRD